MRLFAVAVLAAGLAAPSALARKPGDPQTRHTAADQALARSIVLRRSDLPAGWEGERDTSTGDDRLSCPGFAPDLSRLVKTGEAESLDFSKGSENLVSSFADVYRSVDDAREAWRLVIRPGLTRCLERTLTAASDRKVTIRVLSARRTSARYADQAAVYRLVARFTASGTAFDAHLDLVFMRGGRGIAGLLALRFPEPVDRTLETRLARTLSSRLARA